MVAEKHHGHPCISVQLHHLKMLVLLHVLKAILMLHLLIMDSVVFVKSFSNILKMFTTCKSG